MRFILHSSSTFERWDWTATERGIGGSETCHIEWARRLAARGHHVISYAPVPWSSTLFHEGVWWKPVEEADYSQPGTWLVFRAPELADQFPAERYPDQQRFLICQDVWYPTLSKARADRFDAVIALCQEHGRYLIEHYSLENVGISSNGISSDRMALLAEVERDPCRIIYASSPDRGLLTLLRIFRRVREQVPAAELHIYYGWNNIDKAIADWRAAHPGTGHHPWEKAKADIARESAQPGVEWHGRIGQAELWSEYLRSGLWVYPTDFSETSCITCMEAQALGAIPVTRPYWPLAEHIEHGVLLEGNPVADKLVRARYVKEIVELMGDEERQAEIRSAMMPWARRHFDWDVVIDQVESWGIPAQANPSPVAGDLAGVLL